MTDLLRMRNVSVTYRADAGDVPAVREVDLDVDSGEIVGLAGESGCGKSTLGQHRPEAAAILGNGDR